jgi:hypothetical protein
MNGPSTMRATPPGGAFRENSSRGASADPLQTRQAIQRLWRLLVAVFDYRSFREWRQSQGRRAAGSIDGRSKRLRCARFLWRGGGEYSPPRCLRGGGTEWGGLRFRKPFSLSRALTESPTPAPPQRTGRGEPQACEATVASDRRKEGRVSYDARRRPRKPDAFCLSKAAEPTGNRAADLPLPPRGNGATKLQATAGDRTSRAG